MECSIKVPWGSCFPAIVDIAEHCVYDGGHCGVASYHIGKANAPTPKPLSRVVFADNRQADLESLIPHGLTLLSVAGTPLGCAIQVSSRNATQRRNRSR